MGVHVNICYVLAITSTSAFLEIENVSNVARTLKTLHDVAGGQEIIVAVAPVSEPQLRQTLTSFSAKIMIIGVDPTNSAALHLALKSQFNGADAVLIVDASYSLVSKEQILRTLDSLSADIDAVRPVLPFTETLKIIEKDAVVKATLDRTTVKRISTPELIRVLAITDSKSDQGWFLPLKSGARTLQIESDSKITRINSERDIALSALLLQ
ncbi:MAG: 2-C-methyl-D-erythritol 4-phosphate cytidylyltransferase [Actinobacteria bacterium]|nr:2-C-methyl-D-erythritol 4-phosphate cytidylyltransferase [Actinomycetota bacterium]